MTIPSFFIVGAPKCGTTALSAYLAEHPDVSFSTPKEPNYFGTDFDEALRWARTPREYDRCFRASRVGRSEAVGEGSVWYLYSRVAVPQILRLNPRARFVVMLRNPVDLVRSLHAQFLYAGYEDIEDFGSAWRAQGERRRGYNVPRLCPDSKLLLYGDVGALGTQLERLLDHVSRDQVHLVLFDDFVRDTKTAYRQVLAFLGLDPDGRDDFEVVNANRVISSKAVAHMLHRLVGIKRRMGLRSAFGIWSAAAPWLTRREKRPPLPAALRQELVMHFHDEVERLSRLTRRDLSHWRV